MHAEGLGIMDTSLAMIYTSAASEIVVSVTAAGGSASDKVMTSAPVCCSA